VPKPTDIRLRSTQVYFLPVQTRIPLKFGTETTTSVTCARACVTVTDEQGRAAKGWGETPLSVQWVWPGKLPYEIRHQALKDFTLLLAKRLLDFESPGHPMEIGYDFQEEVLPGLLKEFNEEKAEPMPWLAALVCLSPFDLALHDAYGQIHGRPTYSTYNAEFMNRDLADFLVPNARNRRREAASQSCSSAPLQIPFQGKYPQYFLAPHPPAKIPAWHLVGGLDLLETSELTGQEPKDGYPVLLPDWIKRDGLKCLKVKLRGTAPAWDYERLVKVGNIAVAGSVDWLSADFNCTVSNPVYVNLLLDRLRDEFPRLYGMILYVEQPFPYELEEHRIDVRSVSARKPLFLDESAHDWKLVKLGQELGWSGVALKTCKTQTGALLGCCWAKAHGMSLMVQDLTNPMLAQVPHVLLAAQVGTIMGVETNAPQFYPEASRCEEQVHPGLYRRRDGQIDLSSIRGPGFGYRVEEIKRDLPEPAFSAEP